MKLTAEQVDSSVMALAFVQALLKGDEKFRTGTSIVVQEDGYTLDSEVLIKGTNASHRHTPDNKENR